MNFKKFFSILLCITLIFSTIGCSKKEDTLTTITLNEVAHSIFYAPQYVAINNGYFEEEGIKLNLVTGFGADKVMTSLISNDAQIGFMGSESSVYVYNEGNEDYAINFAKLTNRAGNFLVSRQDETDFDWSNLKGKTIVGGRNGGMPEMVLEYILKKKGINPDKDVTIIKNIDFGSTAGAFSGGTGDYTVEFEPSATLLENEGNGYVVSSLGIESGFVPYTAYCAKKSYIEKNPDIIQKFTNAIQKGLNYVNSHSSEEIALIIAPSFPESTLKDITKIVERYKSQGSWKTDTIFDEESYNLLLDILKTSNQLEKKPPYKDLVTTDFSIKAVN